MNPFERLDEMLQQQRFFSPYGDVGIVLRPYRIETFSDGRTVGYRLYVKVVEACNMPADIFVYQRKPIITQNAAYKDDFSNIASLADLAEYEVNQVVDPNRPFFRLDYVDLVFRNISLLVDALVGIYSDTAELVWAVRANEKMLNIGDLTIGNLAACHSSSSSSSSSA
jgi:hypothetical protein